ncbi:MAG: hypothetical protein AABN95_12160 [Acidobacteriota bacterium]
MGEPLPRPERELPSFGRSLILAVTGALLVLLFVAQTVSSFAQKLPTAKTSREAFYAAGVVAFDYLAWFSAAQTAAWRLKWLMIPVTLLVLFGSRKLYRSIVESPARFCGLRAARRGYIATAAVPLLVLILIGVTVPERLEHRREGIRAGFNAQGYRIDRALGDYQKEFGTLPSDLNDLTRLPDADGTLASALKTLDPNGYKPSADLAAAPSKKPRPLRGAVILNASSDAADDAPTERISFTNYELLMPGPDKQLGTEDDLIVRDGLINKASEAPRRLGSTTGSKQTGKP